MKKVILKFELKNREIFEEKLNDNDLEFSAMYWQHDRVYVPRGYKKGMNYPRLVMRTEMRAVDEPPVFSLILRRHIEDSGVDIIEKTPITDYSATVNIILQLGFKPAGEVSRRREDLKISDAIIMHLDSLDGRDATYVKIESTLKGSDSVTEVREDLAKTMESFGESAIVSSAYFEL